MSEKPSGRCFHIAGEFECRCGAIKDFGEDFLLPETPYEIKCDACGAVLISGEDTNVSSEETKS